MNPFNMSTFDLARLELELEAVLDAWVDVKSFGDSSACVQERALIDAVSL